MFEIITKIAIVTFGFALYKVGTLSASSATIFAVSLVVLNFLRDINLRYRQAIRTTPGYGFWFCAALLIIAPTNAAIKKMVGLESWGLTHWEAVAAAGSLSMFFRAYVIVCESISRWTIHALGWDNRRVDYAFDYSWRNGGITRHLYWNPNYLQANFEASDDGFNDDGFNDDGFNDDGFNDDGFNDDGFNYNLENNNVKCITCCPVQPKR